MTSGVLKVDDHGDGIWAVHGTPADSALVGLFRMRNSPPDLVVSGTNSGQNLGASTISSGTVGAALTAANYGVSAIAVSAGMSDEASNMNRAYALAADITRQVIAALEASRPAGSSLLPDRTVININHPSMSAERLKGIKVAPLSRWPGFTRQYSETGTPGEVRSRLVPTPAGNDTDTDLALFTNGYTTVTILDGDTGVDANGAGAAVLRRLAGVTLRTEVRQ
jgi:5'/3'-nucleotidase SurE